MKNIITTKSVFQCFKLISGLKIDSLNVVDDSWWWRALREICGEGSNGGWFHENVAWKVGTGAKINFRKDTWCGPWSNFPECM